MFTGIVEELGTVRAVTPNAGGARIEPTRIRVILHGVTVVEFRGGRGVLISGVPGVAPANVVRVMRLVRFGALPATT